MLVFNCLESGTVTTWKQRTPGSQIRLLYKWWFLPDREKWKVTNPSLSIKFFSWQSSVHFWL